MLLVGWSGSILQLPNPTPVYFQILEASSGVEPKVAPKPLRKIVPADTGLAVAQKTLPVTVEESSASSPASQLDEKTNYIAKIAQTLNQKKEYPDLARRMRQQGKLKVRFILERDGRILNAEVIEQSDFESLNRAAKKLLNEIKSFEPFPQGVTDQQWAVTVPIEYIM